MWRENRDRVTNVERETWQESKRGEKTGAGGQIWRENRGKRTNVESELWVSREDKNMEREPWQEDKCGE